MARASVAAAGFALAGGSAADPAGVIHIAPHPDRFGRVLLVCVEPLDFSPRGWELTAVALRALRETFAATPGTGAAALVTAFAAANLAVMAENRPLTSNQRERRICVGATGIAIAGREITVAQAPPSQAILVQDRQVYAFPDLASWRGDYLPDNAAAEPHPLGFSEHEAPRLFQSEAAPGDLIALCATNLGRALGRDDDAVLDLYGGSLLDDDLEGSVDRLERLLAAREITDAFAVVAAISRLPGRSRLIAGLTRERRPAILSPAFAAGATPIPGIPSQPASLITDPYSSTPRAAAHAPPFAGLRDWAIEVAEVVASHRRQRAPGYDARRRALAAPGALSVQRYREASGLPPEWRANLPRGPGIHLPARLLAISLVLFLTLGGTGIAAVRQRDREARAEAALVVADTALRAALENQGTAMASVAEAERAVATAKDAGAQGESLARREQELASVRDRVWGVRRLGDIARIGALPAEAREGPVRLALAGRTLYLAAGSLYQLDPDEGRLLVLLSPGDTAAGGSAGDLRHVSIDGGNLVASDGAASYARDKQGRWQRRALAVADVGGLRADAPLITWGEASYGLSWDGDIVRFDQSSSGPLANVWADAAETPDLTEARDLAIDGRIHVLLADGRTLTFSRGALAGTLSPFVVPTLEDVSFLAQAPFATAFYIVDRGARVGENAGRIVRVDAAGDAWQYLTPLLSAEPAASAAALTLAGAEDVAIDELTGIVYWVSGGDIWRASLPLA